MVYVWSVVVDGIGQIDSGRASSLEEAQTLAVHSVLHHEAHGLRDMPDPVQASHMMPDGTTVQGIVQLQCRPSILPPGAFTSEVGDLEKVPLSASTIEPYAPMLPPGLALPESASGPRLPTVQFVHQIHSVLGLVPGALSTYGLEHFVC